MNTFEFLYKAEIACFIWPQTAEDTEDSPQTLNIKVNKALALGLLVWTEEGGGAGCP